MVRGGAVEKKTLLSAMLVWVVLAPVSQVVAGGGAMHAGPGARASALYGRLWDGVASLPISGGYVFALDTDGKKILGHSTTQVGRGPDSGGWQITGLPASGSVWLVGFHPKVKMNVAFKKVPLSGRYQKVAGLTTHMSTPQIVSDDSIFALLGTIAHEANRVMGDRSATALAETLLQYAKEQRKGGSGKQPGMTPEVRDDIRWFGAQCSEIERCLTSGKVAEAIKHLKSVFSAERFRRLAKAAGTDESETRKIAAVINDLDRQWATMSNQMRAQGMNPEKMFAQLLSGNVEAMRKLFEPVTRSKSK